MDAPAPPGLRLRDATPDDRDAVCALLAEAAAQTAGEAHHAPPVLADPAAHDWLYWNNPWGPPANVLWEQDGEIVAHAGMYRLPGLVEAREPLVQREVLVRIWSRRCVGHLAVVTVLCTEQREIQE